MRDIRCLLDSTRLGSALVGSDGAEGTVGTSSLLVIRHSTIEVNTLLNLSYAVLRVDSIESIAMSIALTAICY